MLLKGFFRVKSALSLRNYIAFERNTAGTYTWTVPETRHYTIDIVGGGAGGGAIYRQLKTDHNVYARWAFGGGSSGHSTFGPFKLTKGTVVTIVVGAGGNGLNTTLYYNAAVGTYGGSNGGSSTVTIGADVYSCDGAEAGYLRVREGNLTDTYRLGQGGAGNVTNGNNGQGIINATNQVAQGGESVFNNAGGGGDAKQSTQGIYANNGVPGYVGIKVV